uniref:CARD domain-containing protein n=1 Tax=Plectus sambesii TaxID=2011161 RepID=A0A914WTA0_9BILA
MDELKQEAIKSYYAELVECMDPLRVMDRLAKLLSLEDMELIRESHSTYQERNRKLISILLRKREEREPFERFVEALKRTDASHENMAEAILKTYLWYDCVTTWSIAMNLKRLYLFRNMTMVLLSVRKPQDSLVLMLEKLDMV